MSALREAMSHAVLGWVKPELDETLRLARGEIEAFVETPTDGSRMRFCAGYLHQVQGTLRMVELYAPAMVAEELEQLAQALQEGNVTDREEACATLMRGAVLLPDYLERLQDGHRDIPIVLLPLLNEIRNARGASGLNESMLFPPGTQAAEAPQPSAEEIDHARSSISGRNRELLDTVGGAVKEELLRVKDALDLHLRTRGDAASLQQQVAELGNVADTLGMMGLGVARDVVQQQRDALRDVAEGRRQADEGTLLDIAGALLYVDASLDDQVARLGGPADEGQQDPSAVESQRTVEVLAQEAIINFASAREKFVAFIETNWDHAELAEVPRLLDEVAGAMRMLELDQAGDYLLGVRRYVSNELIGKRRVPGGQQLDTLADALASLEYYLEALRERRPNRDDILEITRSSLENLRYWPLPEEAPAGAPMEEPQAPAQPETVAPTAALTASIDGTDEPAHPFDPVGFEFTEEAPPAPSTVPVSWEPVELEIESDTADDDELAAVMADIDAAASALAPSGDGHAVPQGAPQVPHAPPPVAAVTALAGGFEVEGGDIDDEIREVFLEEFDEEIVNLRQLLPAWRMVPEDLERLRPIRRVFHTLKGSGRLVGAKALGEFSWKVENMLNRVLDRTRAPSTAVAVLLEQACDVLPQLNAALRGQAPVSADLEGIKAVADRIAAGEEAFYSKQDAADAEAIEAIEDGEPAALGPMVAAAADSRSAEPEPDFSGTPASVDSVLREILEAEVATHLETVHGWLSAARIAPQPATEPLLRAMHTMNGAFAMADVPEIIEVTAPAEQYIKRLLAVAGTPAPEGVDALSDAAAAIARSIDALNRPSPRIPVFAALSARLAALRDTLPDVRAGAQLVNDSAQGTYVETVSGTAGPAPLEDVQLAPHDLSRFIEPAQADALGVTGWRDATGTAATTDAGDVQETGALPPVEAGEPLAPAALDSAMVDSTSSEVAPSEGAPEASVADATAAAQAASTINFYDVHDVRTSYVYTPWSDAGSVPAIDAASGSADDATPAAEPAPETTVETTAGLSGDALVVEEIGLDATDGEVGEEIALDDATTVGDTASLDDALVWESVTLVEEASVEPASPVSAARDDADEPDGREEDTVASLDSEITPVEVEASAADAFVTESAGQPGPEADGEPVSAAVDVEVADIESEASFATPEIGAGDEPTSDLEAGDAGLIAAGLAEAEPEPEQEPEPDLAEAGFAETEATEATTATETTFDAAVIEAESEALPAAGPAPEHVEAETAGADADTSPAPAAFETAAAAEDAVQASAEAAAMEEQPEDALDLTGLDLDLVEIFVEEGNDLLDHSDDLLARLRETPEDRSLVTGLQRDLHTLKGGARMAGIHAVGDLGHAIESMLESIVAQRTELDRRGVQLLERGFDALHEQLKRVSARRAVRLPEGLIGEFVAHARGLEPPAGPERVVEPAPAPVTLAPLSAPVETEFAQDEEFFPHSQQEQVRVRADLLDRLVNHAGEVAIYRARLEQQLGAFRGAMAELERTNIRLHDQLRRLDLETEAQIVARYQREQDHQDATFDPLELDRFSTLQQLSRALAESAADISGLQGVLDDLARNYDSLLHQQSRVSSELQDGLMRARMVPFEGIVPRLRRVLRQAAADTGKQVRLLLEGTHGEMDRNVLERMTAPLEHLLRNSVAHGLESPDRRTKAGKPEEGTVQVHLRREGSEMVLSVRDDGAGLNRTAIRERAEQRGLLQPGAAIDDIDLDRLILESGFSTYDSVSQLAGRGVGMDVVYNEVRQLGGSLDIASRQGEGAEFTLRLPQTLAVTQAAFVQIGETQFAVPVASVSGIGRISHARFEAGEGGYVYGGEEYTLYNLGHLVGHAPARAEGEAQVPLLLIRAGDMRAAVAVDQVLGNREIVVKAVGPQLASIPGIYGATITGDGSVVVILDIAPLVRRHLAQPQQPASAAPVQEQRRVPLVMVVDDSLTMRKVTGRVLERHNFEVTAARDGVEALEKLEDRVPDLMLLDIEMPRMDGYELATAMKADPRFKDVPIVMITSRTGDKHRQRAFDIGVQRYMGKPYQELDLMRNVYDLLGIARVRE
ncbi:MULTISPECIES: Hpt domain-containing protein [unclassified Pseudoxanthomonas]|uniref:Hpt domain-containing protein n=1 Tax=unclassified Pseudoxanthomonas TaxID=2645906 RepID=UPI0016107C6A|nr:MULTISPECIES: Hpt domain-containing protein [unclassified Pseudoxanthomonas]MBB3275406.1 chemosensory pili system protein ChpA (sensor histidine kinase/response regulator) [Pseudoxanthomonas sp. OG2]MBV7473504.1 Hpt domain-containing protein [Pseudoxanthomonas sp. PXM05]